MRFQNIDLLKGLLIILVIIGHVLQGKGSDNIVRYIIYSFHMPIFIGVSGFLFNREKIGLVTLKELVSKYFFRVMVPWAIAVIGYMIVTNLLDHKSIFSISALLKSFIFPYYHLWFIPAFLSWVFMTWASRKLNISTTSLLVVSAIISVGFFILNTYQDTHKSGSAIFKGLVYITKTFRPYFYVFFVFGIYLRNQSEQKLTLSIITATVSFIVNILLFFYPNTLATTVFFFLFNLSFLNILLIKAKEGAFPGSNAIQWLGTNSLGVYLWHVVPILLVTTFVGTQNLPLFYGAALIAEIVFILLMVLLTKVRSVNKYLFGMS